MGDTEAKKGNTDIYESLRRDIISLELHPGQRLRENELAEQFGVSRTPVRSALQRLESEGLVYTVPKSGNFVTKINLHNIYNTIYIRNSVDKSIFRDMIDVLKDIDFQKLSINLAKQKVIWSLHDESLGSNLEFMNYDDSFHRDLYAVVGLSLIHI